MRFVVVVVDMTTCGFLAMAGLGFGGTLGFLSCAVAGPELLVSEVGVEPRDVSVPGLTGL